MARFSLELRDLEAAAALEALGMVPETQWPGTEASTLELSTDSEVTFRKVLGSAEVLATITWSGPAGSDQAFARLQSDHTVASSDQSVCHRTSWHAVSCCVPRVWSFDHPGWTRKPNYGKPRTLTWVPLGRLHILTSKYDAACDVTPAVSK